jgi:pimeloyl-ACP methyl ester carboxylesterase
MAIAAAFVLSLSPGIAPAQPPAPEARTAEGRMPNGNLWTAEVPAHWNGTLLLDSHGYGLGVRAPALGPAGVKDWLLQHGYALAASSYSTGGWAVAEAVPDQIATLDEFAAQFGKPKRTIAWGGSMGGLITVALAERHPDRIDAAIPYCGSISGSLGMMNMALDGAFTFKTLLAPDSDIQLMNITDDTANAAKARAVAQAAQSTPQGRARLALAGVMAQLPPWSDPKSPEPAATDYDTQEAQAATAIPSGMFFPRTDQEQRAKGAFSWNTGVDYRAQLNRSGRRAYVEALYREAGLDLNKDLATLTTAPRLAGDPAAIAYMRANYVPTGKLTRPVFSFHTIGDSTTMVTKQGAYGDMVAAAGRSNMLAMGWVRLAGHCTFTPAEMIAALRTVEARLDTGKWDVSPEALNARAAESGLGGSAYMAYRPAVFLRPCSGSEKVCAGEPVSRRR